MIEPMDATELNELEDGPRGGGHTKGEESPRSEEDQDILDPWYRNALERIESLPENRSGADKSWVSRCLKENEDHFSRARRK